MRTRACRVQCVCRVTGCSGEDVSLLVQHVLRLGRGDGGSGV